MSQDNSEPSLPLSESSLVKDLIASVVVFLVALPLCLGIALASDAPLFAGLLSGIIGGIIVGSISGSHTSVSGPAAGLAAIVVAQLAILPSFESFLLAVFIAGLIQIGLGVAKAGFLSAFFPTSVIKGLLAAIGVLLILKQFPHVMGHDKDPMGEMQFSQPDVENMAENETDKDSDDEKSAQDEGSTKAETAKKSENDAEKTKPEKEKSGHGPKNTFSEIWAVLQGKDNHLAAAIIGISSILLLIIWDRVKVLKNSLVPGPLVVVIYGVVVQILFSLMGGDWKIDTTHLVSIPTPDSVSGFLEFLRHPDWRQITNGDVYIAAFTIAVVASLETLLNLEAVDKLDTLKRDSPPSRELVAQGVGNTVSGLVGGLPVTSVIVRSSVNVGMGAKTKLSAIMHGILLLFCVVLLPHVLNMIPLAALAAILLVTGFKLASAKLMRQMWREGKYQFIPFIVTLVSIVLTDLLIGILIGLLTSIVFILKSNLQRPVRRIVETHLGGEVLRIELPNQVSFLNKAALEKVLEEAKPGTDILIDATETHYMDPDIRSLIHDFIENRGPARDIVVSLRGFQDEYDLKDDIQFADYSSRELQDRVTPVQVLELLKEGNRRFQEGTQITRDFRRQVDATATGQTPLAAILSCIDSRVPAELVFDLGIGDIFSVRVAGNIIGTKSLGSIEYGVGVAGVKLVLVLGHTRCGAVTASVQMTADNKNVEQETGCQHIQRIVDEIAPCVESSELRQYKDSTPEQQEIFVDEVAERNVLRTVQEITERSAAIRNAVKDGQVMVIGAVYDVTSGNIKFLNDPSENLASADS